MLACSQKGWHHNTGTMIMNVGRRKFAAGTPFFTNLLISHYIAWNAKKATTIQNAPLTSFVSVGWRAILAIWNFGTLPDHKAFHVLFLRMSYVVVRPDKSWRSNGNTQKKYHPHVEGGKMLGRWMFIHEHKFGIQKVKTYPLVPLPRFNPFPPQKSLFAACSRSPFLLKKLSIY